MHTYACIIYAWAEKNNFLKIYIPYQHNHGISSPSVHIGYSALKVEK